jgi:Cu-Zn family superoxide dismutase
MLSRKWFVFIAVAVALTLAGCPGKAPEEAAPAEETAAPPPPAPEPRNAVASLQFADAYPNATGSVVFTETDGGVAISAQVDYGGETRVGLHGFHLHETGDCSAADYTSAGGHFDPTGVDHGGPDAEVHHGGDFGNVEIGDAFTGSLEMTSSMLSFEGTDSVVGRAVILHAGEDDLTSQPTGAAGARDACGVVELLE